MTTLATGEVVAGRSTLPPADYIDETRRMYDRLGYPPYRWAERTEPPEWTPLTKPLSHCRVMLIGSGGIYSHGQIAFHNKDDTSIRLIANDTPTGALRTAHFAYDQADARRDPNCVFPLDPLRDLVDGGVIGGLTDNSIAFMGGIYSSRRMRAETARAIVDRCRIEQPDLVLLVSV